MEYLYDNSCCNIIKPAALVHFGHLIRNAFDITVTLEK